MLDCLYAIAWNNNKIYQHFRKVLKSDIQNSDVFKVKILDTFKDRQKLVKDMKGCKNEGSQWILENFKVSDTGVNLPGIGILAAQLGIDIYVDSCLFFPRLKFSKALGVYSLSRSSFIDPCTLYICDHEGGLHSYLYSKLHSVDKNIDRLIPID